MKVSLLLVLLACSVVFAQNELKLVIDDFTVGGNQQAVVVTLSNDLFASDPPIVQTSSFNEPGCTGLIGCGRDMEMRAFTGFAGRSFESDIFLVSSGDFPGEWAVANPKTSSSLATIQYDGQDSDFDLDLNGLGNFDLTLGGDATILRISAITDLATSYDFTLYSPNGNTCDLSVSIPATPGAYNYQDTIFQTQLTTFSGNCDLDNIGAIEVQVASTDAVDSIIRTIDLFGPPNPSESRTPSPSFIPSQSRTPSRVPSESRTPTPTPSPSTPPVCDCVCPLFQCGLIYAIPDDDDDNIDDDNHDDDDLVYIPVYYGPVDDDFDKIAGDDDDNELVSLHGGLTIGHIDDDDEATSSSTVLSVSIAMFMVVIAVIF